MSIANDQYMDVSQMRDAEGHLILACLRIKHPVQRKNDQA